MGSKRLENIFVTGLSINFSGKEMAACDAVSTSLFPHQRVALGWMVEHEITENVGVRGGILADDMGLGKTLTVISLILTNHWDERPLVSLDNSGERFHQVLIENNQTFGEEETSLEGGMRESSVGNPHNNCDSTDVDSGST